jgi:3-phenylpropionate/trans-cinnamate dioxygenase ferredoxin subunit
MTAINTTLKVDDLKPGKALRLVISGHPIALIKAKNGALYALDDKCSHGEISLSEGFVDNTTIECWAHGAKFSLETGEALTLPAFEPVSRYEVIVENDEIYIEYDAE